VTLRAVVAGCGAASALWMPTLVASRLVEVVGLADLDETRARKLAERHDLAVRVGVDPGELLDATGAGLLIDLTPPQNRLANARVAFERGRDVLAEKPMAESVGAAREIVALAEAGGRRFAVMQNHRFHAGMRALRAAVEQGRLGPLGLVCADFAKNVPAHGWRAASTSALLEDMAIHTFDQGRYLAAARPLRVFAHEWNPAGSTFTGGAAATATFELEGGAVFSYRGQWSAPGGHTPWFAAWKLVGRDALAHWDGSGTAVLEWPVGEGRRGRHVDRAPLPEPWQGPPGHPSAIEALLRALRDGRPAETEGRDNVASLAMVEAALASCRRGCWVDVEAA
jgi:predicted dehydrogenase